MAEIVPSVKNPREETWMTLFELLMRKKTKEPIVHLLQKAKNVKESKT